MKSPWRITGYAVRQYLAVTGQTNRGTDFERAERELVALAIDATTSERVPKELNNGSIQYRGGLPLRLRYIVVPPSRHSDELPTLVDVLPDHANRLGPYTRSAHQHKKDRSQ